MGRVEYRDAGRHGRAGAGSGRDIVDDADIVVDIVVEIRRLQPEGVAVTLPVSNCDVFQMSKLSVLISNMDLEPAGNTTGSPVVGSNRPWTSTSDGAPCGVNRPWNLIPSICGISVICDADQRPKPTSFHS
jgi:hypothetical protein